MSSRIPKSFPPLAYYCSACWLQGKRTRLRSRQRRFCGDCAKHTLVNRERDLDRALQLVEASQNFRKTHPERAKQQSREAHLRRQIRDHYYLPFAMGISFDAGGPPAFFLLPAKAFDPPVYVDTRIFRGFAELREAPEEIAPFVVALMERYPAPSVPKGVSLPGGLGTAALFIISPWLELIYDAVLGVARGDIDETLQATKGMTGAELVREALAPGSLSRRWIVRRPKGLLFASIVAPPVLPSELSPPLHTLTH